MNKECEAILAVIESLDWFVHVSEENEKIEIYIEKWSPAGEDLVDYLDYDGTPESLVDSIREVRDSFDIEEHIEMWIDARGTVRGVPSSTRTLVEDAEAIQEMYNELYEAVDEAFASK